MKNDTPTLKVATKLTAFRCPAELLEKAKRKAEREDRSLSNLIVRLLRQATNDHAA